ncbi:cell division protein FtsL [Neobacillus vireti]|uniref:Cell division protein FtsL n=1 Tax=Neobacillus vireti LMG 21834 TaxID=1131730 RepID=A0AB94ILP0_9BACI|nr:cell division protein FtsL [Neobacillus vireti]ETI67977.1 cell division protein FtsL [Neobacillus vireti LMG 21834]KLT19438.1 cell division protein [Neobacillus vireti]
MSNLARNLERQQQVEHKVEKQSQLKIKKSWLTPGEKIIGIAFAGLVCFGSVHLISNQANIYKINTEIQTIEAQVNEQQKVNSDLQVQVREMSTYERIRDKAKKMGLELNNDNVKVVHEK